jgi:hypothetical protein
LSPTHAARGSAASVAQPNAALYRKLLFTLKHSSIRRPRKDRKRFLSGRHGTFWAALLSHYPK